jgi:hypothetical protein
MKVWIYPEIDTVLFSTESLTVFSSTIGTWIAFCRKDCLTVLDFVGNQDLNMI